MRRYARCTNAELTKQSVDLRKRVVRIYQPTRNTMQSGGAKMERWRIDFDILPGSSRWENPLMGWASSADYVQGQRLTFRSKEDAAHFAEKQGASRSLFTCTQSLMSNVSRLGLLCVCRALEAPV